MNKYNKLTLVGFVLVIIPITIVFTYIVLEFTTFYVVHELVGNIINNKIFLLIYLVGGIVSIITLIKYKYLIRKIKILSIVTVIIFISFPTLLIILSSLSGPVPRSTVYLRHFSDIKQLQTALEMYYYDADIYPEQINYGEPLIYKGITYISVVPMPLFPNSGSCPLDFKYKYTQTEGGKSYKIVFCIGDDASSIKSGVHIATPAGIDQKK